MTGATEADRFERKYVVWINGCWLWIGAVRHSGANSTIDRPVMRVKGRLELASHVSWRIKNGPVPEGMHVLHTCDHPMCVNIEHLFLGTQVDNMRDMAAKGRNKFTTPWKKLTDQETLEIKQLKGYLTSCVIGKAYGIHDASVRNIQNARGRKG